MSTREIVDTEEMIIHGNEVEEMHEVN